MSRTVDLFLDSDQPLDLVAAELSELIGAPLSPSPDRHRYALQDGGVTVYLSEHDFLDDDDLPLSEFPYVLSAQVRGAGDIDASPEARCLRRVNALWRDGPGLPSLLVIDLERLDLSELEGGEAALGAGLGAREASGAGEACRAGEASEAGRRAGPGRVPGRVPVAPPPPPAKSASAPASEAGK